MKKFSLTRRLIGTVVVSHLALAACLAFVGTTFSRHYLRQAFDLGLEAKARSIAALVYYADDGSGRLLFASSKVMKSEHSRHLDFFVVRSDYTNFEAHTAGYDPTIFDQLPIDARYWNFTYQHERYRAIILRRAPILDTEEGIPQPLPTLTVIYAMPSEDIPHRVALLAEAIGGVSLLLVIPTLLLTLWSVRKSLTPLHALAARARAVSIRNWEFRPSGQERSVAELEPLIGATETVLLGLQRAFTRQREFLGDAAHELKTAFAIMKSTLQLLVNRDATIEEYRNGLLQMSEDADRLENLLNRMLRLARVEQWAVDGIQRELEITDLAGTCEMAVARISKLAAARDIRIECTFLANAELPADRGDLELVWMNLLENAVKYSPAKATVSIMLTRTGSTAEVSVVDQGCGIAERELPHIFERFHRGDPSRSRATGGYGLGLAIAKSIVEAYRGSILVSSELGRGTRVIVRLPVTPTNETLPDHPPSTTAETTRTLS